MMRHHFLRLLQSLSIGLLSCSTGMFLPIDQNALADGRLLRGERWQRWKLDDSSKADFYVASNGNDSWSGTLAAPNRQQTDGPFATLDKARVAVRKLKKSIYQKKQEPIEKRWIGSPHHFGTGRDILVLVRTGIYQLSEPLTFGPEDGGERCETNLPSGAFEYHKLKDYFVTYAAFPGERPILCGGTEIGPWVEEEGLWTAPVDGVQVDGLVVEGQVQTLARTPNEGYYTLFKTSSSADAFRFQPGELRAWPEMQENRIVMLLRWHTGINSIARIDEGAQKAYLREEQQGIRVVPPRYYVENVRALLDAPGEWFFDRKNKRLSYLPAKGLHDPNSARTIVPLLDRLITVTGVPGKPVRNLRFYGLELEAATSGGHAVSFQYAHRCELLDTTVRAVKGIGIHLSKGCYHNRIMENRVLQADQGGIIVTGNAHPEKWFDTIRETVLSHNFVADCGGRSISATNSLYTFITHNEVTRNRGRTAIHVGGWSNLEEAIDGGYRVEFNHLHHVQREADDSGAITTAGLTCDSIVRGNLIHDVRGGFFNDNVAIWFDNMSSGWRAEQNIYYNLDQGQMKLCACNLVDNIYQDNYLIEPPANPPQGTIDGVPALVVGDVHTTNYQGEAKGSFETGESIIAIGNVTNSGSTGVQDVDLYVDGKQSQTASFPSIQNNQRQIRFHLQFAEPGEYQIAIGDSATLPITLVGPQRSLLYHSLTLSDSILPAGGTLHASAQVQNIVDQVQAAEVPLVVDGAVVQTAAMQLAPGESRRVSFKIKPNQGIRQVMIGDTPSATVRVYPHRQVAIMPSDLKQHCSGTAAPCQLDLDNETNQVHIKVAGTDFYHGEDSYGTAFLQAVRGNFIATAKIERFGPRTHEWFRAGLYTRNNMEQSYDTGAGSLGSALMFATPGRVGMNWDEHGDGCMHKAKSQNRETLSAGPIWLRLVRHGKSFSGYFSNDGQSWTEAARTESIPGLANMVDVGLAAGGPDQRVYEVEFKDFTLEVEEPTQYGDGK